MENPSDDDTYVLERAAIKLTAYDRRLKELRDLQEKRSALLTHPDSQRRIAQLDLLIEHAQKRFDTESKRSTDDAWRRRRDIDDWRSRDGRELRNASRRKVRSTPNEDLSHLTPEEKVQRKRGQRADANFIKRKEQEGMPQADIQAALLLRQQERAVKRMASKEMDHDPATNPAYGMF
ncbi:hypothetical protein GOZ78_17830 [Agrobacterium vitis]|uniref:Uncharacterized protein n=1 Tax=Agrobacterium vitis TaxID=373 RepID=A0ABD6GHS1_AGRVI|nr:hypothetical protein [Agrobacterium vitis]MUO79699.1 hypothetical protein [Agrobacterium vitis]MUO96851.1 hypothetical protein [Agrobacterium vitis]MUP07688.1 hypothetical protein [Agrobacterium vitis]MUZ83628.1 hypothetical protein [Agrobacterium vitis]MVA11881.1 hypothetical protein [Agrobacterium vitis]